jgi:hypothetical protein
MSDLSPQSDPKRTSRTGRRALAKIRMAMILKRASTSRPSGEWSDDDYDVLADGASSAAS